jgi:hypothetical protein
VVRKPRIITAGIAVDRQALNIAAMQSFTCNDYGLHCFCEWGTVNYLKSFIRKQEEFRRF